MNPKTPKSRILNPTTLLATTLGLLTLAACTVSSTEAAPKLKIEVVAKGLERPWSLNFAPDGRLLFTGRYSGKLSSLDVKTGEVKTLGQLNNLRPDGEGGMMGMELASDFAQSGQVFICYSYYSGNQVSDLNKRNRLSSFLVSAVGLGNEKILLDEMPGWWNHNGCRVIYSPDKQYLFVSMGEANGQTGGPEKAQDLNSLGGKIFRIKPDGQIPTDNPFYTSNTGDARAIWSYGHRNAQGLAFQPETGALWSTEHGPNTDDELNIIKKGKNYGWPYCVGTQAFSSSKSGFDCTGAGLTAQNYQPAVKSYLPETTVAPSDMIFYTGGVFEAWRNQLLFVTLKTGRLYRVELEGEQVLRDEILIDGQYGRLRDVTQGPDGFLYISTDDATSSSILRIKP